MDRIYNDPNYMVEDMLKGFVKAHKDLIEPTENARVLKYKNAPVENKVGIVTGGGSGHKPAFIGYIGKNLCDAVAVGEIFSSPTAAAFLDAFKAADSGKGVACLYGNYAGDNMNVKMAVRNAKKEGITVKTVRDEPCYMWHEFKKCWKGNWKQSVPAGVLFCTLLAMECIAAWYYMFMQSEMNVLLVAFVAFSLLLLTICWLFTTLQMLYLDMPLGGMLKNSLLIMFGYAKRTLPAGLITLVIVIGVVLFVPVPIMLLLLFLGMPALVAVIGDMWAWPVMEQAFHISEQQAARRAEQEGRE